MIPASFDYVRPATVDEAVSALARRRRRRQGDRRRAVPAAAAAAAARLPGGRWSTSAGSPRCAASARTATRWSSARMTTHYEVHARPAGPGARPLLARPPRPSPTRRSGTAARSAARWRTPTRPVTCRRSALALDAEFVVAGPAAGGRSRRRTSSSTTADRAEPGRGARRGAGAQARRRAGATTTRSSTGPRRRGRSSGSPPRCAGTTARSRRRGWG